jgi:hypothetical protein
MRLPQGGLIRQAIALDGAFWGCTWTAHTFVAICGACALAFGNITGDAKADEGGLSFWLPGQFGSLAAAPLQPGLSWRIFIIIPP